MEKPKHREALNTVLLSYLFTIFVSQTINLWNILKYLLQLKYPPL